MSDRQDSPEGVGPATDEPHALSACIGLPCRTAGKFLEVLSLILSMIVEIVARPSSAVMIP
ncbi:MAG: hypothetical protein QF916_02950 [Gammaproteobacteria bacterium]|nr:hypothetical protein [Gammaproteobacteria bacterium]